MRPTPPWISSPLFPPRLVAITRPHIWHYIGVDGVKRYLCAKRMTGIVGSGETAQAAFKDFKFLLSVRDKRSAREMA